MLCAAPPQISSRKFYVAANGSDANDGSAARPWASVAYAASKATAGATVHVAPGTYFGAVQSSNSGTANARIRFVSDARWGALIRTIGKYTTWKNTGDYVDIEGFDISGDGTLGIANWASNTRIVGNHVHDIPAPGCTSDGGSGIVNANYQAHDDDIIANVVHDIGNVDQPCPRVHGIYHANRGGHVWNNIAYRNQAWGIHLWHAATDTVVANNLVFHNGEGGIVLGAGDAPGGVTADNMVVVNNMVLYNGTWGPGWAIREVGRTGAKNVYLNNLIYGQAKGIGLQNGLSASGTINADPKLMNFQPNGGGDYHPSSVSPAIGAGTPQGAPSNDFDGAVRSGNPDIGPYQMNAAPAPWPWAAIGVPSLGVVRAGRRHK